MTAFSVQTAAPLHLQIAEHLERRIVAGELRDGCRLPNTVELAAEYGVTPVTVQKSLQRLVGLDLLERVPRRGTFVKAHQTANQVGIVFGFSPFLEQSSIYLRMIALFREQACQFGINVKFYYDMYANESSGALYELRRDIAEKRLKALIAIAGTEKLMNWLREQHDIPWISTPDVNYYHSVKIGVEYLLARGYRRITVVSMFPVELPYYDFQEGFAQETNGLQDAIANFQADVSIVRWGQTEMDGYREAKKLFTAGNPRPDAIFVHHDVLTRGVLLALMEAGLKIPGDIALLTHANLGCEFASPVELSRVLIDPREIVDRCLRLIKTGKMDQLPGKDIKPKPVDASLIPGKSCGE